MPQCLQKKTAVDAGKILYDLDKLTPDLIQFAGHLQDLSLDKLKALFENECPDFFQKLRVKNSANVEALRTKPGMTKAIIAKQAGYPIENLILSSTLGGPNHSVESPRLVLVSSFANIDEMGVVENSGGNSVDGILYVKRVFLIIEAVAKWKGDSLDEIRSLFEDHTTMIDYIPTPMLARMRTKHSAFYKLLLDAHQESSVEIISSAMESEDAHFLAIGDVGISASQL